MNIISGLLLVGIGLLLITGTLGFLSNSLFVSNFQMTLDDNVLTLWRGLTGGSY
jgi:hypothetical protein